MGYQVIYVADDGTVTVIPYIYQNGFLQFSTGHFSEYAIVKDPTGSLVQLPEAHNSGEEWLLILAVGVVAVGAIVAFLVWKRRKK